MGREEQKFIRQFGQSMEEIRIFLDISLNQIQLNTGISKQNLSRYERGIAEPSLTKGYIIAQYLCTTLEEMLENTWQENEIKIRFIEQLEREEKEEKTMKKNHKI